MAESLLKPNLFPGYSLREPSRLVRVVSHFHICDGELRMGLYLKLEFLPGDLALLTFDCPGQKVNTFSTAVMNEFQECVEELAQRTDLKGLIFTSGKQGQFIAGADLTEVSSNVSDTKSTIERDHRVFSAFSQLPFPTVALIDGACMGGGTELVLSFDYRIAGDGPQTKIGLPEVKIGLIPGWGGTQRLPRLVGIDAAIEMITSGEPVDARRAVDIGLVYDAVPKNQLIEEAKYLIDESHRTGEWRMLRLRRSQPFGLSDDQMNFAFGVAEGVVKGKTRGQYPAPLIALRAIRDGINRPLNEGLAIEIKGFQEVGSSVIAANLIAQFFNSTRLQRETGIDNRGIQARTIESVGVLGAGLMGAGIATACARRGIRAAMVDVDSDRVDNGLKSAKKVIEDRIAIGRASTDDLVDMLSRLTATTSRQSFTECDLIVEAVTENEEIKSQVIKDLSLVSRTDAYFASNTSTISITRLAKSWPVPERFAGMHFFSPVDRMQLVEVIRGEKTDDETVVTLVNLSKKIGKTPIVVNDCPGFLVNRILMPYMSEALVLLEEGIDMDRIDQIATNWGMPVGPITLYDMVGIDVGLYGGLVLQEGYADRAVSTPLLAQMVELGRLGKKTGKGFRAVDKKGKFVADPIAQQLIASQVKKNIPLSDDEIADRLFLCLSFEAIRALEDKIARHPGDIDMAMILGVNFPAFRGGPLRWCDTEGASQLIDRAKKWESLGRRFEVPRALAEAAQHGSRFYPISQKTTARSP